VPTLLTNSKLPLGVPAFGSKTAARGRWFVGITAARSPWGRRVSGNKLAEASEWTLMLTAKLEQTLRGSEWQRP